MTRFFLKLIFDRIISCRNMKIIILILLVSSVYNLNFVFNVDKPVKKSKNEVPHYQQQRNIFQ